MITMLESLRQPGAMRVEFQPIVRVSGSQTTLYGVEALARGPRGTNMERPDILFEYARRKNEECSIDLISIKRAFEAWSILPGRPMMSVNIHGATLASRDGFASHLLEMAGAHGVPSDRLMIEIVEHRAPWALETVRTTLDELRDHGVSVAVDDLGVGASNYQMIVECQPDHLKIDRHLVLGCSRDPWRRAVLESIMTLARHCSATPIAEGVEGQDDLETLLSMGIDTIQGWLFCRSMPPEELATNPLLNNCPVT